MPRQKTVVLAALLVAVLGGIAGGIRWYEQRRSRERSESWSYKIAADLDSALPEPFARELYKSPLDDVRSGKLDLHIRDERGHNLAMFAAYRDDAQLLEYLLTHGLDANAGDRDGTTAIFYAAIRGNVQIIRLLARHGASPNPRATSRLDPSPLSYASYYGRLGAVRELIQLGADVNPPGDSPLSAAREAFNERFELIRAQPVGSPYRKQFRQEQDELRQIIQLLKTRQAQTETKTSRVR